MFWQASLRYHATKLEGLLGYYSDVFKDTFLFITIYNINGGISPLIDFPRRFTSTIVICFGSSIFIPNFITSIYLAKTKYQTIFKGWKFSRIMNFFMKMSLIILSFFNPVILLNSYENVKEKARLESKKLDYKSLTKRLRESLKQTMKNG